MTTHRMPPPGTTELYRIGDALQHAMDSLKPSDRLSVAEKLLANWPTEPSLRGLVRTKEGTMIHHQDCRYAATGTPWYWADKAGKEELSQAVLTFGYSICKRCSARQVIAQ